MIRRSSKTCYYLNRAARYIAFIAKDVRLPAAVGFWIPVARGEEEPSHVIEVLAANYPEMGAQWMPFVTLLTDFDVDEFEKELDERQLLKPPSAPEDE